MSRVSFFLLASLIAVLDQVSKFFVLKYLSLHQGCEVIRGFLSFVRVQNTGTAFGLFRGSVVFFSALTVITIFLLILYYLQFAHSFRLTSLGLSLILGGALGNLIDRIFRGHVIDFLDFYYQDYHWYTFNVADSAISIGAGCLILNLFLHPETLKS